MIRQCRSLTVALGSHRWSLLTSSTTTSIRLFSIENRDGPRRIHRDSIVEKISVLTSGNATHSKFVHDFNETIASSPRMAAITFLGMRAATWYALVFLLNTDYIDKFIDPFGAEWAMAYLVMRVTGKLRQPLNVVIAATLLKLFPSLSDIKASALMGVIKPDPPKRSIGEIIRERPPPVLIQKIQKFTDWLNGPLDKYGFAYYLAAKCSIAIVICGTAWSIKHGVDIQSRLTDWGVSESIQAGAGSMAAATMINLVNLPAHLYVLPPMMRTIQSFKMRLGLKPPI